LVNLTFLHFGYNHLNGSIPSTIGSLVNLNSIRLSTNKLSGTIPSSVGSLLKLVNLRLASNEFSGTIPASIKNLVHLTLFNVSCNHLTGTIPSWIDSLPSLTYLSLFSNQLTGTIPTSVGVLSNLTYLLLNDNKLTGIIQANHLCNMNWLQVLFLHNNLFTDTVSSCLFSLPNLIGINLSNNQQLTGHLPSLVTTKSSRVLEYIILSNMNLFGSIPDSFFKLSSLKTLVLSSNCITGGLPKSVCTCNSIYKWSLILNDAFDDLQCPSNSHEFSGSLPSCIFASNISTLHLAGNRLVGQLPDIPTTSYIQDLNLASNLLTGILLTLHIFSIL